MPRSDAPRFDDAFRAELAALFRWRRDVRHFRRDPLPDGLLARLLEQANLAPSVGLSQPWRFVTVEDEARRAAIRADFARCNALALAGQARERAGLYARLKLAGLEEAPCHLALFAERDPAQGHGLGRETMPETVAYSAVMALHTLWLAARAEGVGLGWVSILDPAEVRRVLDVPEDWLFIGYLCLGWPEAEEAAPELERLGWEKRQPVAERLLRR
ncbi:MAG: 5,6-dimethylbenzimidazole synthase [Azospirillum brasilense]|nr:MAG: 5,6-dimethylbenzimidazole synthase [Azospirillum brasilense]